MFFNWRIVLSIFFLVVASNVQASTTDAVQQKKGSGSFETMQKEVPQHFYNDPKFINMEEGYIPGEYALPETHKAKTYFQASKEDLIALEASSGEELSYTLGIGEITFKSIKNETAAVFGYFRNYLGIARVKEGKLTSLKIVVDINSMDTAISGRNNRILELFFQSIQPELGTSVIEFTDIDTDGDGKSTGRMLLNGVSKDIVAYLDIQKENGMWTITTKENVDLLITDFTLDAHIQPLLKACNHTSIGNRVDVNVKLYMK